MLPSTSELDLIPLYVDSIDGYLCPGGGDIAPHLYGEDPVKGMGYFNMEQDIFEMQMLKACMAAKKPILGICRGMQLVNVLLGGTMIQDIPSQYETAQAHFGSMDARSEPFHWVDLKEDSRIAQIVGSTKIMTNSFHHQAVKEAGKGLVVTGTAADGIIEAMESSQQNILAVQFHPENLAARFGDFAKLFQDLVQRCQ